MMHDVLKNGLAQLVGMCRPLIAEPDLPSKLARGLAEKAACVRCNQCRPKEPGDGIACHNETVRRKP